MSFRNGKYEILKQGISQDTAEPFVAGRDSAFLARLSPDGAWVIYGTWPQGSLGFAGPTRLMRVPVNGGSPQFVLGAKDWLGWQCSRAPANVCVTLEASQDQ